MKNMAFTLIELLAVIIVLGVILVIVVPNVLKTIENSGNDVYKIKEKNMEKGAKDYSMYNDIVLPINIGERVNVGLTVLIDNNFVSNIYDLEDKSLCSGYVYIEKTNVENYSYNSCLFCTTYQTDNVVCDIDEVE